MRRVNFWGSLLGFVLIPMIIVASFDGIKEGEKTGGVVKLCHSSCIHRWLR